MGSDDIVDFEVIENSKENIQAIPSGRSARALAQLYTPPLGAKTGHAPSPLQTQDAHSAKRLEFEKELMNIDDSDDPLDIYDRYVKWTLEAYPSAQNDKQSQLGPLLERATKAFQSSSHYKNDPRYLKLWLHYIRLFADAPQEIFRFLARHSIGDGLALYYEEFAAWLESAGRFSQAEEIYNMGIEKEARPTERLIRKYGEFQHRFESRPKDVPEPSSPALPAVRPALAAKVDPFAPASPDAQAQSQPKPVKPKSGKPKMAIFSDEGEPARTSSSGSGQGWDSIGTLADRKKENAQEARPWAGETLKGGKTNKGAGKMMIFKDETKSHLNDGTSIPHPFREQLQAVNPKTGRVEVVFVDLEQVYPNRRDPMSVEFSFEELRARHRGWLDRDWAAIRQKEQEQARKLAEAAAAAQRPVPKPAPLAPKQDVQKPPKPQTVPLKGGEDDPLGGDDENRPPSQADIEKAKAAKKARKEERANRTRKIQVMDVKEISGETQTIQAKLDSPSKKSKVRRKKGGREATMTLHTKEAMDDIYEIFNQPLKKPEEQITESQESQSEEASSDDDESDYTSGAESTATRSEFGDETTVGGDFTLGTVIGDNDSDVGSDSEDDNTQVDRTEIDDTDVRSVSAWSDLTESKNAASEDDEDNNDTVRPVRSNGGSEHTDDGQHSEDDDSFEEITHPFVRTGEQHEPEVTTPTSPSAPASLPTRFVPVPPEGHNYPMRPYRDPVQAANNRLPFMTPIVEKTESSLGFATAYAQKEQLNAKTPSRSKGDLIIFEDGDEDETSSSPFQDLLGQAIDGPNKITKLSLRQSEPSSGELLAEPIEEPARKPLAAKPVVFRDPEPSGPIIEEMSLNPVIAEVRDIILRKIQPPLDSYDGYFADTEAVSGKGLEIQKYTKAVKKMKNNAQDKTITNLSAPPKLIFEGSRRTFTVKRELGKGAFAPVYLIESAPKDEEDDNASAQMGQGDFSLDRRSLEALKMEDPPTPWEFYIMRQAKRRLGVSRAADSIVHAYEMHVFQDECYLIEEFRDQGTLLDLVNIARAENGVMDEQLTMFFTVEMLRTVEALHSQGILHGDLKADNVLVRFDALEKGEWDSVYQRDGRDGWASKGISLIDFGRGIDMKAFHPDVQFIADWKVTEADCYEAQTARPWTYQIDYHGLAGIVHTLLFGKYISTVAEKSAGLGASATRMKIREGLKRYWQTEIWHECFDLLLNPMLHLDGEEDRKMPVSRSMRGVREKMEAHLEANCEKGVGLRALVRKMEEAVRKK
ncbi:checkpoint protein kinase [Stagonosporopsis vannaccii]|nr:checkpoint protein kinase [Stagonosporopsis vannaccii]